MTTPDQLRKNCIDRLTEVRGLLETHGAAAALPRLERHIQDLQEMQHVSAKQPLYDALSALADMWNQYCPPPMGHAYMSAGEYAEEVLRTAGLMGTDGVASFPSEPPAPRSLSSLTDGEARECYRLAFPDLRYSHMDRRDNGAIVLNDDDAVALWLWPDGDVQPMEFGEVKAFAAVAVLRYLDSLGIALGAEPV